MDPKLWEDKTRPRPRDAGREGTSGCNCRKSKCLKLYCECFAAATMCIEQCKCQDCHNNESHREERDRACEETVRKNARAFEPKIAKSGSQADDPSHRRGCRCKKSNCLKRYCECFNGKVKCSTVCRCINCHNLAPSAQKGRAANSDGDAGAKAGVDGAVAGPTIGDAEQVDNELAFPEQAGTEAGIPLSPTMTPLLASATWDMQQPHQSFTAGAFTFSPQRAEDLAGMLPSHMATPQSTLKGDDLKGTPAFSPGLNPIDLGADTLSFLISPVKDASGSPLKVSPLKVLGSPRPARPNKVHPAPRSRHRLAGCRGSGRSRCERTHRPPSGATRPEASR